MGQMASDGIECQRRRLFCQWFKFTVRNEPQFDQSLEPVADTENQSVSYMEKFFHSLHEFCVAEYGRNKLAASIRFIPCGKAAGKHDNL